MTSYILLSILSNRVQKLSVTIEKFSLRFAEQADMIIAGISIDYNKVISTYR